MGKKAEKILVLVTAQKTFLRLIECGFAVAQECCGELHILHVAKGESIFDGGEMMNLLQNLVDFSSRFGGVVHVQCEKDIAACVGQFVREEGMTQVVMGGGRERKKGRPGEYAKIMEALPAKTAVTVVPEEARKEKAAAWRKMPLCPAGV